ncbi:MAG TPA: anthranilate phosphoribosyltransferase [Pyrinomonadaceae bacterium]|nr:anthranilate phosphoribosyltransferase [Pyrinomonadaceae bacterium]
MPHNTLRDFVIRLERREDLTRAQASEFLAAMLADDATDAQIAASLVALTAKGETAAELAGMADVLRKRAVRINSPYETFIDTAGTGSSRAKTFNVSTAAAFVIAGAGLPVAKHGNRAASSKSGSADVLTALGVNVSALASVSQSCLGDIAICFMFAPLYHGATARVAAVRRQLGVSTSFNLLGPLSNPAGAPRQIIGVWRRELVELLASVLAELGTERSWVVHGEDGLDEITLTGKTFVAAAGHGKITTFEVQPTDFGLSVSSLDHLRGGDAEANARIIQDVLSGKRRDEARDLVVINSAAALLIGGKASNGLEAATLAAESIDSGVAQRKLEELIRATSS